MCDLQLFLCQYIMTILGFFEVHLVIFYKKNTAEI